jgi:hypothetical protein
VDEALTAALPSSGASARAGRAPPVEVAMKVTIDLDRLLEELQIWRCV